MQEADCDLAVLVHLGEAAGRAPRAPHEGYDDAGAGVAQGAPEAPSRMIGARLEPKYRSPQPRIM